MGKKDKSKIPLDGAWTAIPNNMLRDSSLTPMDRLTCSLLRVYAGHSTRTWPLLERIADDIGVHVRTVQTCIRRLEERGYISRRRTIAGNVYNLFEPDRILTNTIQGSHADTIQGSHADTITRSSDTITGSHASLLSQTQDSESTTTEAPPSLPDGDVRNTDSIREGQTRMGKLLEDTGIVAWRELQEKLQTVPYEQVAQRIAALQLQGKPIGVIVSSLRNVRFAPNTLDERIDFKQRMRDMGYAIDDQDDDIPDDL